MVYLISSIISLVVLVVFFVIAINVNQINKTVKHNFYNEQLSRYLAIRHSGNTADYPLAHQYLLEAYYFSLMSVNRVERRSAHEDLQQQLGQHFAAINASFPEFDVALTKN